MPIIDLTDPADPRLAPYRSLKEEPGRPAAEGRFVIEGEIVLRQAAASRFAIESIVATPGKIDALADLIEQLPPATPVYRATKPIVDDIIGFAFHRGVIAQGLRGTPRTPPQSPPQILADLAATCTTLLIVEEVSNTDNLGGLFRSISALAPPGTGVVLSPGCADPLYRKTIRASMGHVLNIPFASVEDPTHWPAAILQLRTQGYHFAALTPAPGSIDLAAFTAPQGHKLALLVGAEGPGLSDALLAAADTSLRIPMRSGVDSLNLVVATSIAMHRIFS